MRKYRRLTALILTLLLAALTVWGAAAQEQQTEGFDFSVYNGKEVGILAGSWFDALLLEKAPQAKLNYFNTTGDEIQALIAGKIEAFVEEEPIVKMSCRQRPEITYIPESLATTAYAFAFSKDNQALCDQFSQALETLFEDGTIDECRARWIDGDASTAEMPDIPLTGENGTLTLALNSGTMPFVFQRDGQYMGYDAEVVRRVCAILGYDLNIFDAEFAALIPAVVSGRADLAASCITITEERKQSVLFSIPDYVGTVCLVVRNEESVAQSWLDGIKNSFYKTFALENRWQMLLNGLGVTMLISLLSALFGTLMGFGLCMMRRSRYPVPRNLAKALILLIQGTPVVVFLMILYFLVLKDFSSEVLVAVVGFSINFAAYVSEMMRSGIDGVDRGQLEAAAAIGFSRAQTFWRITFPQAARSFLPVYKGEFVSMVKMTSVVGYISIRDLTRASDIIRSRTYEAFFPLITTALIYIVLSWLLACLLSLVQVQVDPKHRKRQIKGVTLK